MTVSIIIAVKAYCENLKECVSKCLELEFLDYEIIILPDSSFPKEDIFLKPNIRIISTGNITPPYKRDLGVKEAKGEIIAFLDDDAYPVKDWLDKALYLFDNENIGCVCGPAVTPQNDSLLQKASGLVYSSVFVSGNHVYRYIPKEARETFDFPSCNFLIRKKLFVDLGGFDKPFWPGEDTLLCLKVLKTKTKMMYDPRVLVFHHRRTLFSKHLLQIKNYALHRGYFAKKYPENSLCIEYFIPSFFTLWVVLGPILGIWSSLIMTLYFLTLITYLALILSNSLLLTFNEKGSSGERFKLFALVVSGIISTHTTYGFYFLKGLFSSKMSEEN